MPLYNGVSLSYYWFILILLSFSLQLVLLVAEEGLFSLSLATSGKSTPRKLPGVEKSVQMDIIPDLGLAIFIAGTDDPIIPAIRGGGLVQ